MRKTYCNTCGKDISKMNSLNFKIGDTLYTLSRPTTNIFDDRGMPCSYHLPWPADICWDCTLKELINMIRKRGL